MTPLPPKRKAAMLLMSLDPASAAELIKIAGAELVTELAAELASLETDPDGRRGAAAATVREFLELLRRGRNQPKGLADFKGLLESALGADQSQQIMAKAQRMAAARDPFSSLRDIEPPQLVEALAGESPQVVGMVLAELPSSRSAAALGLLPDAIRPEVVKAMASGDSASSEVRLRIATAVQQRLKQKPAAQSTAGRTDRLRRVALLLRAQPPKQRQPLIDSLSQQDADMAKQVNDLMVIWEDVGQVVDRSLQEALRVVDTRKLALALVGCDEKTAEKIRRNISERARASLDEEKSLLSSPGPEDAQEGRTSLLEALRGINGESGLRFEED